ncbi:MAG: NERD domain-containing protein [Bacillota bacterium]
MTIVKDRKLSFKIEILKALVRRLDLKHPKFQEIKAELGKCMAGFRGEKSINYFLNLIPELNCEYLIFHDLRLPYKQYFFQIDTLILFPNFYLVLEIKNYVGTLHFDHSFQQLIKSTNNNGIEDKMVLGCPIVQVQRQQTQIKAWFKQNTLPDLPGECLVVMANPNAQIIAESHKNIVEKFVIRSSVLSRKIEYLHRNYAVEVWSKKDLKKASNLLLKGNQPTDSLNISEKYGIKEQDLVKGIHCPKCENLAMKRIRGCWYCLHCSHKSKDAHMNALKDYNLLIDTKITIAQFKRFLGIVSDTSARRIIKQYNIPSYGITKGRYYLLDQFV